MPIPAGGGWRNAIEVPGIAASNSQNTAGVNAVSCGSAGSCSAGGYYRDGPDFPQAFVADEVDGSWQDAIAVPGSIAANSGLAAQVNSVSCPADGECVAGGYYSDSGGGSHGFVAIEHNGSWNSESEVTGLAGLNAGGNAQVTSVSCSAVGNCGIGGFYSGDADDAHAFVGDEVGGNWAAAKEIPGAGSLFGTDAQVTSISCAADGDYSAGGWSVASEVNGTWGNAVKVPGAAKLNTSSPGAVTSVSCGAVVNCALGGFYSNDIDIERAFVDSEP